MPKVTGAYRLVAARRRIPDRMFQIGAGPTFVSVVVGGGRFPLQRVPKSEILKIIGRAEDEAFPTRIALLSGSVEIAWEYSSPM